MKLKHMLLALIPLCMASCSEEETIVSGELQQEVRVTAGASNHSRVVLNDEGNRISSLWEAGDKISLFTATQSNLVYSTDTHAATATFTPVDEALECREGNTVYACYPEVSRIADEGMVVGLPSITTMDYDNGSIRSFGYATSTISGGSVNFQFKHISAFIALEVKSEMLTDATKGISRITVSTSSTEPLSVGEGDTFDFSSLKANTGNGTNTVQINVDNHVVNSLWTVYIPILPQPAGADITITLTDSEDQTLYTQTKQTPASGFLAGHTYYQKAVEVADVAYLVDGPTFNGLIKQLANGDSNFSYGSEDYLIKRIEFVGESSAVPADYIVVSTEASPIPIYASFNPVDSLLTISTAAKRMELIDGSYMFSYCRSLSSLDLSGFDTSSVTTMSSMFEGCSSLESLDLSSFDTSNVTDMTYMFSYCRSLESLDLSSFDTSNVTDMHSMFLYCSSLLSLDLSNFDTSNVTYMYDMFEDCSSLSSLDLSSFDTSNVTYMYEMFSECSSLSSLDLSNFDTSNVTDMCGMFSYCSSLSSLDLSSFDTSNVTDMCYMFDGCSSLVSLDLSGFDTSNVIGMYGMFYGCSSLSSLDLSNFDMGHVTYMGEMFLDCASTSKACRVTSTKDLKDFLLARTSDTRMNPDWFIWGDAANGGSSLDTVPKEEW